MERDEYAKLGDRKKVIPFENRIKRANPDIQRRYQIIIDGLRRFNFNDRISIPGETFSYKKKKMIFITLIGETLKVFFKLKYSNYVDSTIPLKDASKIKKYYNTPTYLVIKSDLAARRAVFLGETIAKHTRIPKKKKK